MSRVVVLWSEAALRQDGVPVAQGFTAKVYLYSPDSEQPVAGRGKLTVYAYNDTEVRQTGPDQHSPKPDRSWEFTESELRGSLKKDLIGTYYPLWLPCGPPVDAETRYTLMLCFTPANGQPVLSQSALVTLTRGQSDRGNASIPGAAKIDGRGETEPQKLKL